MAPEEAYFLMEQGAQFDGERLQILRDKEYKKNGASGNFCFLTEHQLSYLEVEGRYNEAWGLAMDVYNHDELPLSILLEDTGMLVFYFALIKQEKSRGVTVERNRSTLSLLEAKLEILSQTVNRSVERYQISPLFRTWLSDAITKDPDPSIAWVTLKKGKSEIRVRRDVLAYWSEYFKRRFSGRWPVPETLVFDSNDEFTTESFIKVFGHFVTTGAYDYKTPEDCYDGLKVARYFLIEKLIEKLEGLIERRGYLAEFAGISRSIGLKFAM
ncbi:BTB/POZ domain-containing protein [Pochonia chlamydosporia 170]|uniref:BTB/POZ domain-containing protein n=1 Tax=Pochonia chlamydosporia 170 TaxID=1380566 RepID=A0A179F6E6_METCM|nr:BTB/POZ domain-containing protein [Pochonia chlamydosporia 170]OAQ60998.1 BTB/POZ domain-containing protein [Pochonia chlamydosporia 170]